MRVTRSIRGQAVEEARRDRVALLRKYGIEITPEVHATVPEAITWTVLAVIAGWLVAIWQSAQW